MTKLRETLRFAALAGAASLGGGLWTLTGLPLGWLIGSAATTALIGFVTPAPQLPKLLYRGGLVSIGCGVGLALTPEVALRILGWAPAMVFAALLGITLALVFAPVLARFGRVSRATAYFSLLPGGVIEMANIGGKAGADPMAISALHSVRLGLVVGLLPAALFAFFPPGAFDQAAHGVIAPRALALVLAIGATGAVISHRVKLPSPWMIGAVLSVGLAASTGFVGSDGISLPPLLLAVAQIIVGISLGLRFERHRLASIPRALVAGVPVLLTIMLTMACFAALAGLVLPLSYPSLVLAFSIGGMAEMILTAKALQQDVAIIAAFQVFRGIFVNLFAGMIWKLRNRRDQKNLPR